MAELRVQSRVGNLGDMHTENRDNSDAGDSRPKSGMTIRSVFAALLLLVVATTAKIVIVVLALVGGGLLGHWVADRPGLLIGVTAGTVIAVTGCYLVVTRTHDSAAILQDVAADTAIWTAAGWLITMGWLLGDAVSDTGAVVGVLLAALVVGIVAVVVASRRDRSLVAAMRRRTAQRSDQA